MQEHDLEDYLHHHIPLSQALGVRVKEASTEAVVLTAPLSLNINHKKTVFGGSLHSVATLACWSLVFLNVKRLNIPAEIVIASSATDYIAAVTADFEVHAELETQQDLLHFEKMLRRKGKARLSLEASIYQDRDLAVIYHGQFAALRQAELM